MRRRSAWVPCAVLLLLGAGAAAGQRSAVLSAAEAGPDFRVQGEYEGGTDRDRWGAQVIALGAGAFRAVFLRGGLPGEGWDRSARNLVDGKLDGERARFSGAGWHAEIRHGELRATTPDRRQLRLRKVLRESPTLGMRPPPGAQVLFDGTSGDAWVNARITPEGWLREGAQTRQGYQDFTLHIEFLCSFMPAARGQSRANSGVFLDGRYEIQVLDSFGLEGLNNECGAIYSLRAPDVNMCLPPLSWQTFDIVYTAPVFGTGGRKLRNAVVSVVHNGVLVHDRVEVVRSTAGGQEGPTPGPIQFMNHGNPMLARNIWLVPHGRQAP